MVVSVTSSSEVRCDRTRLLITCTGQPLIREIKLRHPAAETEDPGGLQGKPVASMSDLDLLLSGITKLKKTEAGVERADVSLVSLSLTGVVPSSPPSIETRLLVPVKMLPPPMMSAN